METQAIKLYIFIICAFIGQTSLGKYDVHGSARFDCVNPISGGNKDQNGCMQISAVEITIADDTHLPADFSVTLDPFHSPVGFIKNLARLQDSPLPTTDDYSGGIISQVSLNWHLRPRLELKLGSHDGSACHKSIHALSLGSRFNYCGWSQLALTARYTLGKDKNTTVEITLGNGEGEFARNIDQEQYAGIVFETTVWQGIRFQVAGSYDGDSHGSETSRWLFENDTPANSGYSNQRLLLGFYSINSPLFWGAGVSIFYGKQVLKDNDRSTCLVADCDSSLLLDNQRLSLRDLFIEDLSGQVENSQSTDRWDISATIPISPTLRLDANYEFRRVKSDSVDFFRNPKGESTSATRSLSQSGVGFGLAKQLQNKLHFLAEYRQESYSRLDALFNYEAEKSRVVKNLDLFNLRIVYNW